MVATLHTVTRQQTCRDEIDLAIDLYFQGGSLICANLLAWAASDVLKGVAITRGVQTVSLRMEDLIAPGKQKLFFNAIKEHYNFAKHADRDPDKAMSLNPQAVEFAIFNSVADYGAVYLLQTFPMLLFKAHFLVKYPDLLTEDALDLIEASRGLFDNNADYAYAQEQYRLYVGNRAMIVEHYRGKPGLEL